MLLVLIHSNISCINSNLKPFLLSSFLVSLKNLLYMQYKTTLAWWWGTWCWCLGCVSGSSTDVPMYTWSFILFIFFSSCPASYLLNLVIVIISVCDMGRKISYESSIYLHFVLYLFVLLHQVCAIWFLEFVSKSYFVTRHDIIYIFWLFLLLISQFLFCCLSGFIQVGY